jgi:hypothetical protein
VKGELQIDAESNYKESNGLISFKSAFGQKLGQIRSYGYAGFDTLLLDASNCQVGLAFRTLYAQGDSMITGQNDQFPLTIATNTTTARILRIEEKSTAYNQGKTDATVMLYVYRPNTTNSSSLLNDIAQFGQSTFKAGESINISLGRSSSHSLRLGYLCESGNSTDVTNTSYLGMTHNNNFIKSVIFDTTGNTSIPVSLTTPTASIGALTTTTLNTTGIVTDTITATNYIGLPATNVSPITLDPTNSRIGINNTTPTKAVDVVGDVLVSGEVEAGTVKATTYIGLPAWDPANALPITLDPTNSRIGINQTTPTKSIDVVGDAVVSGEIAAGSLRGDAFGVGYNPGVKEGWGLYRDSSTLTLYISPLTTAGVPTPANDVSIEYSTGKVILNSLQASTELTVGSDLIKTDTTNTRVGINKATPAYTLDVGGDVNIPTGSNFMINGVPISSGGGSTITTTSLNVFTTTTTAPVKPTTTLADFITVREHPGSKLCDCTFHIAWLDPTGSSAGSGVYFIQLPTGYQFDLTKHPADTSISAADASAATGTIIPGSNFSAQLNSGTTTYFIGLGVVYDSNRFAVLMYQNGKFWSNAQMGFGSAGGASNPQFSLSGSFQFFKP